MTSVRFGAIGLMLSALAVSGCNEMRPDPGQEIYMAYCTSCHGRDAKGSGVLAADLPVPPADLTQLAAANGGVFPSARAMETIYGYPGRYQGHVMPEFGPVLEGPTVVWRDETGTPIETPQALLDLHDYLVSLQES